MLKQLNKHFDVWLNEILFLSLLLESPTSQLVASSLHLVETREEEELVQFDSFFHNRRINITRFSAFISERCKDKEKVTELMHVQPQANAIQKLAEGNDMWALETPRLLTIFRNIYLQNYASLPSNSHLAKSTVKDANLCMIIGRLEATPSMFSTARLGIVERLNITAREYLKNGKIRRKYMVNAGTYGNRKRKLDRADYEEEEYQQRAGRCVRSGIIIKMVKSRSNAIYKLTYPSREARETEKNPVGN